MTDEGLSTNKMNVGNLQKLTYKTTAGEIIIRSFSEADGQDVRTMFCAIIYEYTFTTFKSQFRYVSVWASILAGIIASWSFFQSQNVTMFVVMVIILALYLSCVVEKKMYISGRLQSDLKNIKAYYIDKPRNHFWVAEHNGKIVGTICVKENELDPTKAELHTMSVSNEYRRLGLGSKLVDTLVDFVIQHGYHEVLLDTMYVMIPPRRLYVKKGFKMYKTTHKSTLFCQYDICFYTMSLK